MNRTKQPRAGHEASAQTTHPSHSNQVALAGRLGRPPELRELPSGSRLLTFRLVMAREEADSTGRRVSDWVDCAVWAPGLQKRLSAWAEDDVVEIRGALRRRFYRDAQGRTGTRLEVEVLGGRRVRRAARE